MTLFTILALTSATFAGTDHDPFQDGMALLKAGDHAGAVKAFKALTRSDADNARAWFMLGNAELGRGKAARAAKAFQTALDKGWYPSVGAYNLACAQARAGRSEAAFAALDQALAAGWADPTHMEKDTDLASLRALDGWQARMDQADKNQNPCHHDDVYRGFDFWVGTWEVYDAQGTRVGKNTIATEENGCMVTERWEGSLGMTGRSMSYFDPADGQWHQDWVASRGGVVHYTGAVDEAGAMVLTGTRSSPGTEAKPTRCVWAAQEDGSVLQTFQKPDGDSWTTTQVLTYRKPAEKKAE